MQCVHTAVQTSYAASIAAAWQCVLNCLVAVIACRSKRERFLQFSWRPRPDTLLTADQEAQIAKEFKRYSKKYQEEDELIHTQVSRHNTCMLQAADVTVWVLLLSCACALLPLVVQAC